jgi:hypothetical protein
MNKGGAAGIKREREVKEHLNQPIEKEEIKK